MFASQTPRVGQQNKAASTPRHAINPAVRWLVAFAALLFLLVTPEPSHACANRTDPAPRALQQAVTQVTKRQIVSSQIGTVTSNRSVCCDKHSHHCGGAQVGSCCPACTAALFVTSDVFFRTFPSRADFVLWSCPQWWCSSAVAKPLASAPSIAL